MHHDSFVGAATISIQLVVNSTRAEGFDGLDGEEDLDTDGTNIGGWGGLGGHIRLEARPREGWIVDPWIRHTVADSLKTATANGTVTLGGGSHGPSGLLLRMAVLDSSNHTVGIMPTGSNQYARLLVSSYQTADIS